MMSVKFENECNSRTNVVHDILLLVSLSSIDDTNMLSFQQFLTIWWYDDKYIVVSKVPSNMKLERIYFIIIIKYLLNMRRTCVSIFKLLSVVSFSLTHYVR